MKLYVFNAPRGPRFHAFCACLAALTVGAADPGPNAAQVGRRLAKLASTEFRVRPDPTLAKVAAQHAHEVLEDFGSAHRARVKAALRKEGLADAQVHPFAALGPDPEALIAKAESFAKTQAGPRGMTHVGFALARGPEGWAAVAIYSRRTVALAPLPRRLPDTPLRVRGRIRAAQPHAYWLGPVRGAHVGAVKALPVRRTEDRLEIDLPAPRGRGHYVFQIVTTGPRGPEVAAQWTFSHRTKGRFPPAGPRAVSEDAAGAAALLAAVREAADLAPLEHDPALTAAARRHAAAMCAGKVTAHRIPGGDSPEVRVRKAGYVGRIAENVARAGSVGAAHHNLALSPSHRLNLLDVTAQHVGVAVAKAPAEEGVAPSRCLVQLFGYQR